ncbi:unnamed protein product [Mytilus coruscus]|uniref:Uncharacterized protein n=1 Tax=Mytilus coruscus TaxID=42192 RepID=A0A6J8BQX3_MYTCO|nr:unnamed protein product [Mytilus coruscus]
MAKTCSVQLVGRDISINMKIQAYTELEARHEVFLETFDSESEEDKPKINELNHDLLTEENSALEYMESDLREYGTAKGKINTFDANESENDKNNNGVAVDPLHVQLQENQQVMKQIVEGLAQVAQAMSNKPTNRYNSDKYTGTNRNTEGKFKCWYHKSDNHEIEGPGKQTTLKCGSCKCGKCAIGQPQHSIREERELNIIKSGMTHDEESQQCIVNYPWIKYPNNLPNNVNSAVSRLRSTEKRLLRNSLEYASAYDEQIMDMVKRGIARKLTKEMMEIHSGPVHYIPHHEVLKPESKSTPLRIVFNSSSSYIGHTLNDYWAKGSNVIRFVSGLNSNQTRIHSFGW